MSPQHHEHLLDHHPVHNAVEKIKAKGLKYSAVSVVNVVVGQGLLIFFHAILGLGATTSNVLAVCISAVPAYYLSRRFVWGKTGKSHFRKEVLPFWIFVIIGLVFSTLTVTVAAHLYPDSKLLPNIVNMASFGILWVARFFLMDKLFHRHPAPIEVEVAVAPDRVASGSVVPETIAPDTLAPGTIAPTAPAVTES